MELLRRYSSRPDLLERLQRASELAADLGRNQVQDQPAKPARRPHKLKQRLPAETINELVAAYKSGCSSVELMGRYRLGKGTVLDLLYQHGVVMRRPSPTLTAAQVAEAARLYSGGLSLVAVGKQLRIPPTTLLRGFRVHGVQTRPRPER